MGSLEKTIKTILSLSLVFITLGFGETNYSTEVRVKATWYDALGKYNNPQTADLSYVEPEKVESGEHRWIAISRDLKEKFKFGDTVIVNSSDIPKLNGEWVVKDLMNKRWTMKIDFLMIAPGFDQPHFVTIKKKKRREI